MKISKELREELSKLTYEDLIVEFENVQREKELEAKKELYKKIYGSDSARHSSHPEEEV